LLSLVTTKPFDISSAVFNNDMLNATSVMVIISMACGYLVFLLERKNAHLGTAPRGVYWSIMTFLTVSGARSIPHASDTPPCTAGHPWAAPLTDDVAGMCVLPRRQRMSLRASRVASS
jgi:hypothetical protein